MRALLLPLLPCVLLTGACKDAGSADGTAPANSAATAALGDSAPKPPETSPAASDGVVSIAADTPAAAQPTPQPSGLLSVAAVLAIARGQVPGEIIDLDLDDDDGLVTYEVEVLTPAGRKIEIRIDAREGTVLEVEED